jgi:hypothetical protein
MSFPYPLTPLTLDVPILIMEYGESVLKSH